ncbi:MAG: hypothetical protein ABIO40_09275 [Devosia sp.]
MFRISATITLATGIALHGSRLFVGPAIFQQHIFTPLVDSTFAVPMTIAGIAMALLWRRAILPALWEKIAYGFVTLFFVGSLVLHAKTLITWDTSYVNGFPAWYPTLAVTYLSLIALFCLTRRFTPTGAA